MGHGGGRDDVAGGSWVRFGGLLLATIALVVGVWALALPRSFYDDFPAAGRH